MFKSGIFNWFGYVMPVEERFELIKKTGFDSLMLWWEDEDFPNFIDKINFVSMAKSHSLEVDNIHLPYEECNLFWSDSEIEREKYLKEVLKWIEGCKASGADKIVMHTNRSSITSANYNSGYKSFEKITLLAEDIKIKVAVENTKRFNYTEFILNKFKSDYLGLCYDSSHDFINGESKDKILNKWKDRLFCVHLSDTDGLEDRHWLPSKGNVDFKQIINIISQTNCNTLSMEVYPFEQEKQLTPQEFLRLAYNVNKKLAKVKS